MAKRYTDTDKWKKPFIKSLPLEYKAFFLYLLDECDHAGIWHVEIEVAAARLGTNLSLDKALKLYKDRVFEFDNKTKWFVLDFVKFQYGVLDIKNKVHKSVADKLGNYNLLIYLENENKGLPRGLQDPKDKDKEKDKDMVIGGVGDFSPDSNFAMRPKQAPEFQQVHEFFVRQGKTHAEAKKFFDHYEGVGWMQGITPIINWASFASKWISNPLPSRNNEPPKEDTNAIRKRQIELARKNA